MVKNFPESPKRYESSFSVPDRKKKFFPPKKIFLVKISQSLQSGTNHLFSNMRVLRLLLIVAIIAHIALYNFLYIGAVFVCYNFLSEKKKIFLGQISQSLQSGTNHLFSDPARKKNFFSSPKKKKLKKFFFRRNFPKSPKRYESSFFKHAGFTPIFDCSHYSTYSSL